MRHERWCAVRRDADAQRGRAAGREPIVSLRHVEGRGAQLSPHLVIAYQQHVAIRPGERGHAVVRHRRRPAIRHEVALGAEADVAKAFGQGELVACGA
jgi:hypothetical protein